jgi:hypothetical protein
VLVLGRGVEDQVSMRALVARLGIASEQVIDHPVTQGRNETRIWLFAATERRARRRATPTLLDSVVSVPGGVCAVVR